MRGVRDLFVLLVVLVLQATLLYRIEIAGIRPDLLVAFVVYIAWMRGPVAGTLTGFGVGLLQDLDASGPLGHDIPHSAVATGGEIGAYLTQMLTAALPSALYTTLIVLLLLAIAESMGRRSLLTDEA